MGVEIGIGRGYGFLLDITDLQPGAREFLEQRDFDPSELYEDSPFVTKMKEEFPGLNFSFSPSGNYEKTQHLIVTAKSTYNFTWDNNLVEGAVLLNSIGESVSERLDLAHLVSMLTIPQNAIGWATWVTML